MSLCTIMLLQHKIQLCVDATRPIDHPPSSSNISTQRTKPHFTTVCYAAI